MIFMRRLASGRAFVINRQREAIALCDADTEAL